MKEFECDYDQPRKSELQKNKEFRDDFGITHAQLKVELDNWKKQSDAEWDDLIFDVTGHPNGHHPDAYKDIHINWEKIAECEADGYDWPTMPYLPAPCERKGLTKHQLNRLTYDRRESYRKIGK